MYNLIKIWKFKIDRLGYREYRNRFWVSDKSNGDLNGYMLFICSVSKYKHDSDETRVNLGGAIIDLQWRRCGIDYIDVTGDFIQSAIQNHMNGLFQILDIDLELCLENLKQGIYPNIWNATDILFDGYTRMNSNTFQEIIQMYPTLKSVRVECAIDGEVTADSRLFQTSEVSMRFCGRLASLFLNNFEGRYACLGEADYEKSEVIQFVKDWISGEKFINLTVLNVFLKETHSNLEIFQNELAPLSKQWKRPEEYEFSTRLMGDDRNKTHGIDLWPEQCMDFERETDQKMATFVYTAYCCRLLIWN